MQLRVQNQQAYLVFTTAAVSTHRQSAAQKLQVLFKKVRSYMRRFLFAKRAQRCRALVCLPHDTFGDLSRPFDNQAVLDLVNSLFKLR